MHRIIFQAGPFTLYSYGLLVASGSLLAIWLILRDSKRYGISRENALDCLIAVLIGGVAGGRLLFAAVNWQHYIHHPFRVLVLSEGGLAMQGAILGGLLSGVLVTRYKKVPFWRAADLSAPYLALAQSLGRVGCFLNGCCYGRPLDHGPAVTFPGEQVMRVPTQIYSSLFLLMLFAVLIRVSRRRRFDGQVFSVYLVLYSILRIFMDIFRGDDLSLLFGVTLTQAISLGTLLAGSLCYILLSREKTA